MLASLIAVPLIYYGLQHYISLAGSLVFIPLIMVPAMGGTDVSMHCNGFYVYYTIGKLIVLYFLYVISYLTEGYCYCNFYNTVSLWNHNNTAFLLWYPTAFSTRELICIFGSSISHHKFSGISKSY